MFFVVLALQVAPVPLSPPADPASHDVESAAALRPVQRFFAAIAERDPEAILQEVRHDGKLTGVIEGPGGARTVRTISWTDFAKRITTGTERIEERSGAALVKVDGDIAMAWAPYTFYVDGKALRCGVNHFDLIREGGRWKLFNITFTQRDVGCPAL
jgi:ketosteroid isomerase-like protein